MKAYNTWICILFIQIISVKAQVHVPDSTLINNLKASANRFSESGAYDSLRYCEDQLQTHYQRNKQWKESVESAIQSAVASLQLSDFRQAHASITGGFSLLNQYIKTDNALRSELHNMESVIYFEEGEYDKAIEQQRLSIRYHQSDKTTENQRSLAGKYNNLAAIHSRLGDYDEAIKRYEQSLDIRKQVGDKQEIAESYSNLAVTCYRRRRFQEALNYQQQHLEILRTEKNTDQTKEFIRAYNAMGIYSAELKAYDEALFYLQKALVLNKKNEYLKEKTFHNLGYVYRMLHRDSEAMQYLTQALALNKAKYPNGHPDIGKEYRHLGVLYAQQDKKQEALRYYQLAMTYLVQQFTDTSIYANPPIRLIRSKPDLLRTLRDKATTLRELSSQQPALLNTSLETYLRGIDLVEQMRDEYESETGRQFINEEAIPLYEGALQTLYAMSDAQREKRIEQAYTIIEKSKALLLIESLQRQQTAVALGVPDSLLASERKIRNTIGFYEKQLSDAQEKNDSLGELQNKRHVIEKTQQLDALTNIFKQHYPNYAAVRNRFTITPLTEVRKLLQKEKASMIEYFIDDQNIWILYISPDKTQFIRTAKPTDWNETITSYEQSLSDYPFIASDPQNNYRQYHTSANKLYHYLFASIEQTVNTTASNRLIIIPHDELSRLSFDALLKTPAPEKFNGYSQLDYLIKSYTISYDYSASLFHQLREKTGGNTANGKCLAAGITFSTSRLTAAHRKSPDPLPFVRGEIEYVSTIWNGNYLLDEQATKQTFQRDAKMYSTIHLATHAMANAEQPAFAHLVFWNNTQSRPQELYAYEIANLTLKADMVVLSACETGTGKLDRGEGIASLGKSFLYAGARSVVMNLWRSEDRANSEIVKAFYKQMASGATKAEGLRQSKLQYLEAADEFQSHPAFWAGYVVNGHAGVPIMATPLRTYYAWLVAFLLMIVAMLLPPSRNFLRKAGSKLFS